MGKSMSGSSEASYYENASIWDPTRHSIREAERISITWQWVPHGSERLLDLGCGNGIFCNSAPDGIEVFGTDRAFAPLMRLVKSPIQADAAALPFREKQFDTVVSLEVLEHLPAYTLTHILNEISRVAANNILISVPYCEDRRNAQILCPYCQCRFHSHYHMRSFNYNSLTDLFMLEQHQFALVKAEGIVMVQRRTLVSLARWMKELFPSRNFPLHAVCPQCGFRGSIAEKVATKGVDKYALLKSAINWAWPQYLSPKWWLALYQRV